MNHKAIERLAEGIILQAVADYRRAIWKLKKCPHHAEAQKTMRECNQFFLSSWFATLTSLDGEQLLQHLNKQLNWKE